MSKTFFIIKPDAFDKLIINEIFLEIERSNLSISHIGSKIKGNRWYHLMYQHVPTDVYISMSRFLVNKHLIGIVVEGREAVKVGREIVKFIRAKYADGYRNCLHASDDIFVVDKEIAWFFGDTSC